MFSQMILLFFFSVKIIEANNPGQFLKTGACLTGFKQETTIL